MNNAPKASKVGLVLDVLQVYLGLVAIAVGAGLMYLPAGLISAGVLLMVLGLWKGRS